jgi:small subunit ribosomal protein S17
MPRKVKVGTVVSDKNAKTIVVEVHRRKLHPRYRKYIRVRSRFMAHDENEAANIGDTVRIIESRPLSARKRWVLDAVVTRGVGPEVEVRHDDDLRVALGIEAAEAVAEETAEEAEGAAVEEAVEEAAEAEAGADTAGAGEAHDNEFVPLVSAPMPDVMAAAAPSETPAAGTAETDTEKPARE